MLVPALVWALSAYALLAALRHRFGAEEFSGAAALVACAVILSVPGAVLQAARTPSARRVARPVWLRGSTPLSRMLAALLAAAFALLAVTPTIDRFLHVGRSSGLLLAPCFLISSITGLALGASRPRLGLGRYAGLATTRLIVVIALGFLFVDEGLELRAPLLALLAGDGGVLLLLSTSLGIRGRLSQPSKIAQPILPEVGPRAAGIAAALIGSLWLLFHFDLVLSRHYFPPGLGGDYATADTIARVFVGPLALLALVLAASGVRRDRVTSRSLRSVLGLIWAIALAAAVILLVFRNDMMTLVVGRGFGGTALLLPAFALGTGLFATASLLAQLHMSIRSGALMLVLAALVLQLGLAFALETVDGLFAIAVGGQALATAALYRAATAPRSRFRLRSPL